MKFFEQIFVLRPENPLKTVKREYRDFEIGFPVVELIFDETVQFY